VDIRKVQDLLGPQQPLLKDRGWRKFGTVRLMAPQRAGFKVFVSLARLTTNPISGFTNGQQQASEDMEILRKNASPDWSPSLPVDKLAYAIVEREAEGHCSNLDGIGRWR
jgi:hypothetical protein